MYMKTALIPKGTRAIHLSYGAGDGNRTRVISLEGWGSTIELRPQDMVGTTGFEPATSCSQSRRATKLRHIPTLHSGIDYSRRIEIRRKDFASDRPLPFPAAPTLRASSPNEICASLTTFNPIHQGHHNHSHIRTKFFTSNIT